MRWRSVLSGRLVGSIGIASWPSWPRFVRHAGGIFLGHQGGSFGFGLASSRLWIPFATSDQSQREQGSNAGSKPQGQLWHGALGSAKTPPCVFCEGSHYHDECAKVTDLNQRTVAIRKSGRCFNCLRLGHTVSYCTVEKKCFYCSKVGAHHSSICPQRDTVKAERANMSIDQNLRDLTTDPGQLAIDEKTVMKTALVMVSNPNNPQDPIKVRLFFDTGTSRSYVTPRSAKRLKLAPCHERVLFINRFGDPNDPPLEIATETAKIDFKALNGDTIRLSVEISDKTLQRMSKVSILPEVLQKLPNVPLSDQPLPANTPVDVDIMIGNDYYDDLIGPGRIDIGGGFRLIQSDFGWIMSGRLPEDDSQRRDELSHLILPDERRGHNLYKEAPVMLEDLFSLESIGIKQEPNPISDDQALEMFLKTVKFEDGRYQVTWPYKNIAVDLPTNYSLAQRRLRSLLNRCHAKNRFDFLEQYDQVMRTQLEKGITEIVTDLSTPHRVHYLAHHGVETPSRTTKLRIVFDASAKESRDRPSLNEAMHRGQVFLENIVSLLLRFRDYPIAIIADIEKAFLQVGLQESERDVTRFLWVRDFRQPPTGDNLQTLRFLRVSFGIVASPFLLGATLVYHLKKAQTPTALKTANDIYVDNVVTGVASASEAMEYYRETKLLFREAGMNLREYSSNDSEFMTSVPEVDRVDDRRVKVLGIIWDRVDDTLRIKAPDKMTEPATKKTLLSDLFKVFDPLGLAVAVTIRGRMLLQRVTKQRCSWSSPLPADVANE
jgi:hypothetical protein